MGCGCQNGTSTAAVDPCRRVNYSLGMILGVDDFGTYAVASSLIRSTSGVASPRPRCGTDAMSARV